MKTLSEQLKEYFEKTPKEEIKKLWDKTKPFDKVGIPVEQLIKK